MGESVNQITGFNTHRSETGPVLGGNYKWAKTNLQFGVLVWCSGDKHKAKTLNNSYSLK